MASWKQLVLVLATVFCCIGCDQTSKAVVRAHMPRHETISLAGDTVRLSYAENPGAFLGLGDELPTPLRTWILTVVVGAFLAGFATYLLRTRTLPRRAVFAGALFCGGGLGNWIDRVARSGYVVDFLQCGIGPVRTGIFNLADVAVMAGALLFVLGGGARVPSDPRAPA